MPGTKGINFDKVQAFQDCVLEFNNELYTRSFCPDELMDCVTPHEGVKGKLVLTELYIGDLVRRWRCQFDDYEDQIEYCPRVIEVTRAKVDFAICPQDHESSYLGFARKKGQDARDWPFERYILDKFAKKIGEEINVAYWQAKATPTPTATDKLIDMFDGIIALTSKEIIAGTFKGVIIPDSACIVTDLEDMFKALPDYCKKGDTLHIYTSWAEYTEYFQQYREKYGKFCCEKQTWEGMMLDMGIMFKPKSGLAGTGARIMTSTNNLHYAYDAADDKRTFYMQQDKRMLCMWADFNIGAQIGMTECFAVNDKVANFCA